VTRRTPTIDRSRIRTQPARRRASKVKTLQEARPRGPGASVSDLLASLPGLLGAADLNDAIDAWVRAWQRGHLVLFGFGAHLIKVGLAPIVVDLLERGAIGGLMMNGAGSVHDLELAMLGHTSEDVAEALDDGSFGMAAETGAELNRAINDGAAALVVMSEERAAKLGVTPLARISHYATGGCAPEWVMMAPEVSIQGCAAKAGRQASDFDLHEINEAFSVAAIALRRVLDLDPERVNVNGGAVAMGHPIGASGARILTTLLYAMRARDAKRGIATLCLGGGNGVALAVERGQ